MAPTQQQSSHEEEGDEYVIKTKGKSKYRAPGGHRSGGGDGRAPVGSAARDEDIRRRAYEIYLERGEQAGYELEDWLQAERELEPGALWHAQAS